MFNPNVLKQIFLFDSENSRLKLNLKRKLSFDVNEALLSIAQINLTKQDTHICLSDKYGTSWVSTDHIRVIKEFSMPMTRRAYERDLEERIAQVNDAPVQLRSNYES